MTTVPVTTRPSEAPETSARPLDKMIGLPAEGLANPLDQALDNAAPERQEADSNPTALAGDIPSYQLEDLLCGLPVIDDASISVPPADKEAQTGTTSAPAEEAEEVKEESKKEGEAEDGGNDTEPMEEPEWDPSALSAGNLVAALHALAEDAPAQTEAKEALGNNTLPLTEGRQSTNGDLESTLRTRVEEILAAHAPDGALLGDKGELALPERLDALEFLLADPPPAEDFAALDALYACWPKSTQNCTSRALLAVAHNLSRNFGLPGKLPMASARAWRMLSPSVFEAALAKRLADIDAFIKEWQETQRHFLILEFGEIELIEYLFEALHPGYHADLLVGVMNFKVLSNRRMGLLRRVPNRMKKRIAPLLPHDKDRALTELAHAKALMEQMVARTGFAPIVEAALKAQEELEKIMKTVANAGAAPPSPPPGPGGGFPLGRLG